MDLAFPVLGHDVPTDHGFALFGALCRVVPPLHGDRDVGIHPLTGTPAPGRRLVLGRGSALRIRLAADRLATFLPLAGTTLDVDGAKLRLGVPSVHSLRPAASLYSRLVVIRVHGLDGPPEPEPFLEAVARQLDSLGIRAEVRIPTVRQARALEGRRARPEGTPLRRTLRVADRQVVGYAVSVRGLDAEDSLALQAAGLGGRRRFGCGVFVPTAR